MPFNIQKMLKLFQKKAEKKCVFVIIIFQMILVHRTCNKISFKCDPWSMNKAPLP